MYIRKSNNNNKLYFIPEQKVIMLKLQKKKILKLKADLTCALFKLTIKIFMQRSTERSF